MRRVQAVSRTNRGLVRPNNEDSILMREPDLFAIADGMGGYNAGEVASFETVRFLSELKLDAFPEQEVLPNMCRRVEEANEYIWDLSKRNSELKGMGTTLTVVYLRGDKAFVCHVGDSRIYLLQGGQLKQVTSDHSLVADLVRDKKFTAIQAEKSQNRNYITRAIGADEHVQIDSFEFLLGGVQRMLLCTDGLFNMIEHNVLEKMVQWSNLTETADLLMNMALHEGGKDNVSFIILNFEEKAWTE